jgi:hypothetical protein
MQRLYAVVFWLPCFNLDAMAAANFAFAFARILLQKRITNGILYATIIKRLMKTYCESGVMKYGRCCIPFYIWVWGQVADDGVASLV